MVNKKKYNTPIALKYELMSEPIMLVTSGEIQSGQVGNGSAGNQSPDLVNESRSEWGNLWGNNKN
jgi:hypothetical protein